MGQPISAIFKPVAQMALSIQPVSYAQNPAAYPGLSDTKLVTFQFRGLPNQR